MIKLSVVIITYNEEKNIGRCVDSVRAVADEIIIVDSFSKDNTCIIAQQKGARVVTNTFEGFTKQKNFAVTQASYDYILSLDADEYLSSALEQSILRVKSNWEADGYTMNRLNKYADKWIKSCGWYPDRKIRLWDRRKGKWEGGLLHEVVALQNDSGVNHLKGDLLHLAYQNASQLIGKMQTYSEYYAMEHRFRKKVSGFEILYKTLAAFFKNYFLKGGIWDGYEGLVIAASNANGVLYKYAKLLEANRSLKTSLIITTYNRKDALELVLLSVLNQIELPNEVIVADDGSREDTKSLVDAYIPKFPIPLKHVWQEDKGFRAAAIRNKSIAKASSEYIIIMDGDLVLHPAFVKDHKLKAKKGFFIQGSRVLLDEDLTNKRIAERNVNLSFFERGIKNRMNLIHSRFLSSRFSYLSDNIYKVRSMNLSFWLDDAKQINGFNEDFVGWGREDSEFAVRMMHAGIKRLHLKFAGFGYHLYHAENSRVMLAENQRILDDAIEAKKKWCPNGIDKYIDKH